MVRLPPKEESIIKPFCHAYSAELRANCSLWRAVVRGDLRRGGETAITTGSFNVTTGSLLRLFL